jgi:5-methylcytosine-specific restriction endonuclease McrA
LPYRTPAGSHPGGISKYAGRSTRRYRKQRADFRQTCAEHINHDGTIGAHCWLDGRPIDYTLPREHPEAFNLDHAFPVSTHPELAEDPANFRPSHKDCNERRGDNDPFIHIGSPSEDW